MKNFEFRISNFEFASQPPMKLPGGRGKNPESAMRNFGSQDRQQTPDENLECAMKQFEIRNSKFEIWGSPCA
jgi:hypothetical protein